MTEKTDLPRLEELYNSDILGFAGNIGRIGRLNAPDASASAEARLCGSAISVDIRADGRIVTDFAQEIRACVLGQAAAAIVAEAIIGASFDEILAARSEMLVMLKEGGPPPSGRFAALKLLEPVRDYKPRHASTMLIFEALAKAIGALEPADADEETSLA